ncbi:MAG: phytanoyl-CoA dioxygenase family protein [Massilia sp.]
MKQEQFASDGYVVVPGVLTPAHCARLAASVSVGAGAAGSRSLLAQDWCAALAIELRRDSALAGLIPATHVAVQCNYFEKSASCNWLVPLHQDLSIPVADRVDGAGLRGWSEKEGELFVHAPPEVLGQLIALRLHLDPCGAVDGPLKVVPGSHASGRMAAGAVADRPALAIEADIGDALLMRPLLLHASSKSAGCGRRRVLHVVFGPPALPQGLSWRHAI